MIKGDDMETGRLKIISDYLQNTKGKKIISIGAKRVKFGNEITVDIDKDTNPDIIADARKLPFKDNSIDVVIFTEVIEHIEPPGDFEALKELNRILKKQGTLILSTPNRYLPYNLLDFSRFVMYHSSYSREKMEKMLSESGFKIKDIYTSGGGINTITHMWHCLVRYPLKKIKINIGKLPIIESLKDKSYEKRSKNGFTLFAIAKKE